MHGQSAVGRHRLRALFGGERSLAEAIVRDFAKLRLRVCVSLADTIERRLGDVEGRGERKRGEGRGGDYRWQVANCRKGDRHLLSEAPGGRSHKSLPLSPFLSPPLSSYSPPGTPPAFFDPLPVELLRLPRETLRWLHELGIASVGQLEMLPREAFLARFGPVLLTRLDQLMGRLDEPVPAAAAERQFAARWSAEYPTLRRETIEGVLEHLSARVAAALDRCGWGLAAGMSFGSRGRGEEGRGEKGDAPFAGTALWVLRTKGACPLFCPSPLCRPPHFGSGNVPAHGHRGSLARIAPVVVGPPADRLPVAAISLTATQTAPLEPRRQTSLFDFDGRELARRRSRKTDRLGRTTQ